MASLESLNDDCLREILQYCNKDDLIAFVVAFKQFKLIVQDIWKISFWRKLRLQIYSNAIKVFRLQNGNWRKFNAQSLKIVVDLIQPFIEEIYITGQNKEVWDIIIESQFAKTTKLLLRNTSAAPIVKACFPNLRSLVLGPNAVVKYSPDWNGVENVDVRESDMSTSEIMEFISQLKLKKFTINSFEQPIPDRYHTYEYFSELEEIRGSVSTMKKLANALNGMQKLRKVSVALCLDFDWNISIFSKILGTRTVEFFFKFICTSPDDDIEYLENRLQEFPNLKRLTLECSDVELIEMFLGSRHLHLLKAIILKHTRVDAEILTNILISVPQLEFLGVNSSRINSRLYQNTHSSSLIHLDVASIAKERTKPVTINLDPSYCHNVRIEKTKFGIWKKKI